jgi:hypothetical protein
MPPNPTACARPVSSSERFASRATAGDCGLPPRSSS